MPTAATQIQAKNPAIVAPCGINCSLCRAYMRDRDPCPGCRGGDASKSNACLTCAIRSCSELAAGNHRFCFSCDKFPCEELSHLDHRYRTQYGVSVIDNLIRIKVSGVKEFIAEEAAEWSCPECGSQLCMHRPQCPHCGNARPVE